MILKWAGNTIQDSRTKIVTAIIKSYKQLKPAPNFYKLKKAIFCRIIPMPYFLTL